MLKIFLHRVAVSAPLLILVSAVTFILQALVPGDPARTLLGVNASQEQYQQLRDAMNLDAPFLTRYWDYLSGALQGDLGESIFTSIPVVTSVLQRLPVTLTLMLGSVILAAIVGIAFGVWSATRGQGLSKGVDTLSMVGFALPNFWLGLVLVSLFAISIPLFPATGFTSFEDSPSQWLLCLVLPWAALSLNGIASIAKVTRDSMKSTLDMDYIRTLRAAGVRRKSLIWKHALKNSGIPILTMTGLTMIHFLSGTVLIENVFALPGLGTLAVNSINSHDTPVTQGVVLTFTLIVIIINLIVDMVYTVLNPKVRIS